jgi:hypothetical protein
MPLGSPWPGSGSQTGGSNSGGSQSRIEVGPPDLDDTASYIGVGFQRPPTTTRRVTTPPRATWLRAWRRPCLQKICNYPLVPKSAADVAGWAAGGLTSALTDPAGYLSGTQGLLGPSPNNGTAPAAPAAGVNPAFLPLLILPPLVLGAYAAHCAWSYAYGSSTTAGNPGARPQVAAEAVPLQLPTV